MRCGSVSVIVYGDQDKPALVTYPDLALNREYNAVRYHRLFLFSPSYINLYLLYYIQEYSPFADSAIYMLFY